jgi:flagellin
MTLRRITMPVISTNTAANTALRYLNQNETTQSSALAKLASGSRITQASDDAAGLAVGTQLQSDVTVLSQASTNASQATSMLQSADGGLSRISDILQRMKSLATESASGNVTNAQRSNDINTEYTALYSEIDTIAQGTRYAGSSLLQNGLFSGGGTSATTGTGSVTFIVGTSSTDNIAVTGSSFQVAASSLLTANGLTASSITTQTVAISAIDVLTTAIDTITGDRAQIGAYESQFNFQSEAISTTSENNSSAASTVMDCDVASEKSTVSSADVKTQAAVAALSQANQMPSELLKLLQ